MNTNPAAEHIRRSMIYRVLQASGAQFETTGDAAVVMAYGEGVDETALAGHLGIGDLSPLARTGFKGRHAPEWLVDQGVEIPTAPNQAKVQADGALVARLSNEEHLVLGDLNETSDLVHRLDSAWEIESGRMCYHMPRAHTHAWFAVTGSHVTEMFSKICGVDLREHRFPQGAVAQTSVARINAIVVRSDSGHTPTFHVLADSASAEYLWGGITDAMQEFSGAPVGLAALCALVAE